MLSSEHSQNQIKQQGRGSANGTWKIIGVYTSAIIGAGFASGQELLQFFARYGAWGIAGLIVAGALFAFTGWATLDICFSKNISNGNDLLKYILGEKIGVAVEVASVFFMFVLYATMMAASGASLREYAGAPFTVGVIAASGLTFAALLFDLDGLVAVSAHIAPFLIVGGLLIGLLTFVSQSRPAFADGGAHLYWLYAAVTYAAYNIVTSIPVLSSLSVMLRDRKSAKRAGLIGGGVMTALGLCMLYPLYLNYSGVRYSEIPLLIASRQFGWAFQFMYMMLFAGAVFTTALSNGYAVTQWLIARVGLKPMQAKIVLALAGMAGAYVGFSMFVSHVYPLFGLLGLFETSALLGVWLKRHVKPRVG